MPDAPVQPVTLSLPAGVYPVGALRFDNRTRASEVRIEGVDGLADDGGAAPTVVLTAAGSNTTTAPPGLQLLPGTTAHVFLSRVRFVGRASVLGGQLTLQGSTLAGADLDGSASPSARRRLQSAVPASATSGAASPALMAVGLEVRGGYVHLQHSELVGFAGGGIAISDGTVVANSSAIRHNGRHSGARIGGLEVTGGVAILVNTLVEANGYAFDACEPSPTEVAPCIRGGGVRVDLYGRAELREGSLIRQNAAYEGSSLFITQDTIAPLPVSYDLPAPAAHYLVLIGRGVRRLELGRATLEDETFPFVPACQSSNPGLAACCVLRVACCVLRTPLLLVRITDPACAPQTLMWAGVRRRQVR